MHQVAALAGASRSTPLSQTKPIPVFLLAYFCCFMELNGDHLRSMVHYLGVNCFPGTRERVVLSMGNKMSMVTWILTRLLTAWPKGNLQLSKQKLDAAIHTYPDFVT